MKINKALSVLLAAVIILSASFTAAFAASGESEIDGLSSWLLNDENTEFDFSETSYLDTDICWTVFALERAGKDNYAQFGDYINSVVENSYDSLFPANFALIYLTCDAYGLDVANIGSHDIQSALVSADYASQTYLSSLYFPLIALNYKDIGDCDEVKNTIADTILSAQQSDGGFPYCSIDTGWGIYSDVDTTSFVLQALAPMCGDEAVKAAVDKALAYIETQKFSDGAYGYVAYDSRSAESTAQAIIAKCALGTDCEDSVIALKTFINAETGAAKDYSGADNTMSSYQTLLALVEYDNFVNGNGSIYKYQEPVTQTTTQQATSTEVPSTAESTTSTTEAEATTNTDAVDIPKTGGKSYCAAAVSVCLLAIGTAAVVRKKNEEI